MQGQAIGFGLGIRWEFKAEILIVEVKAYMEALGILLIEPPMYEMKRAPRICMY